MPDCADSRFDSVALVLERFQGGHEDAADELYRRYKYRLISFLQRKELLGAHLKTDLATTELAPVIVVKLLTAIAREKLHCQGETKLFAWLITVMFESIAEKASRNVAGRLPFGAFEIPEDTFSPNQLAELADATASALAGLDDLAVPVFDLWSEGYSQRQIAVRLHCSRRRVQRLLEIIVFRLHHRLLDVGCMEAT